MQGGVSASPDDRAGRAADWRVLDWIAMEGVVSAIVRAALGHLIPSIFFFGCHINAPLSPFSNDPIFATYS